MVKRLSPRGLAPLLSVAALTAGCLGRTESTDSARTLPFHAHEETLRAFPQAPIDPPTPRSVGTAIELAPFVGYYPLPVGFFVKDAAYNEAGAWAPILIDPAPEVALAGWFQRSLRPRDGGASRRLHAVVTHFEWSMLGIHANAGRIVSALTVTDPSGAVVFTGTHRTEVRVPFVDALFRVHVGEWLKDPGLMQALGGEVAP